MPAPAIPPAVIPAAAAEIYFCANRNRRTQVLAAAPLNGIDYLEVASAVDQTLLLLAFLRDPSPLALVPAQIVISGGESITGIRVLSVTPATDRPNALAVTVDAAGDFSTYALSLRADDNTAEPPNGVDPALSQVAFSFKAGCPVSADCLPVQCCPAPAVDQPDINYLAKDYPGFLQVMLDRMAVLTPGWTERHAADFGVTLVEVMAYLADHLSYRQDAVATEAYLGTARSRISLRRHAKLVDYQVDEGENAKVWLYLAASGEGVVLPLGTLVLPRVPGVTARIDPNSATAQTMLTQAGAVFASLSEAQLSQSLNQISFYTWSDTVCCLPVGATTTTLSGHFDQLQVGAVLLFEETKGPSTGAPEDANPRNRWVVRLTGVTCKDRFGNMLTDPANSDRATDTVTLIASHIDLDTTYSGLAPLPTQATDFATAPERFTWLVLSDGRERRLYGVQAAADRAPLRYTLSAKATGLRLDRDDYLAFFVARTRATTAFIDSEPLVIAPQPLTDWAGAPPNLGPGMLRPVAGSAETVAGGAMLAAGQTVAISGNRARLQRSATGSATLIGPDGVTAIPYVAGDVVLADAYPPATLASGATVWAVLTTQGIAAAPRRSHPDAGRHQGRPGGDRGGSAGHRPPGEFRTDGGDLRQPAGAHLRSCNSHDKRQCGGCDPRRNGAGSSRQRRRVAAQSELCVKAIATDLSQRPKRSGGGLDLAGLGERSALVRAAEPVRRRAERSGIHLPPAGQWRGLRFSLATARTARGRRPGRRMCAPSIARASADRGTLRRVQSTRRSTGRPV